ncbi:hypothetical protein RIF29_04318 [Crotalaria pallida]|uniref:Uncharacterized protein n=1 Tax=Crotalaria pallida TaxID=3830 RepID=A0AAN9PAB2_CROPI
MLHAAFAPTFCTTYPHCPRYIIDPSSVKRRFSVRCSVSETNNGGAKVGFEIIDSISQAEGIRMNVIRSKALIGIGSIGEVPVLLAKPQTYMNFSGESVYDEMSLPNGVLRLQHKGGHGHHNG